MTRSEGHVRFQSLPTIPFRYSLRETADGEPVIWLESRKTREQWYVATHTVNLRMEISIQWLYVWHRACTVGDTGSGPGIPRNILMKYLEVRSRTSW